MHHPRLNALLGLLAGPRGVLNHEPLLLDPPAQIDDVILDTTLPIGARPGQLPFGVG